MKSRRSTASSKTNWFAVLFVSSAIALILYMWWSSASAPRDLTVEPLPGELEVLRRIDKLEALIEEQLVDLQANIDIEQAAQADELAAACAPRSRGHRHRCADQHRQAPCDAHGLSRAPQEATRRARTDAATTRTRDCTDSRRTLSKQASKRATAPRHCTLIPSKPLADGTPHHQASSSKSSCT